jgi:hypothetical protein
MMTLWKKKDGPLPQSKLEKRIASIPSMELTIWAENTAANVARAVAGRAEKSPELYADAEQNAEALLLICKELKKRSYDQPI